MIKYASTQSWRRKQFYEGDINSRYKIPVRVFSSYFVFSWVLQWSIFKFFELAS